MSKVDNKTETATQDQSMNPHGISRRQLLFGMGLGGAALMAGAVGCSPQTAETLQQEADSDAVVLKEADETIDTDIVILGSGTAGMSAAITAAEEGAQVVLLEKQAALGGGSNFAEGVFGMGSKFQQEAGVSGDIMTIFKIEFEFQKYIVDYTLWKFVAEGAEENLKWLEAQGVEFIGLAPSPLGDFRTQHLYPDHRGANMIAVLERVALDKGVTIYKETPGTHLLMDGERVVGVQSESGGKVINVNAKAVILATGSSGENSELFDNHTTRTSEKYMWCGAPGIVGDGIRMAGEAGMGKPYKLMGPIVGTTVEPLGISSHLAAMGAMNPFALWVNQNGVRFTNEGLVRTYTLSNNAVESQVRTYSIIDQKLFDELVQNGSSVVGWGYYMKAGTPLTDAPQELEKQLDLESENVFRANTIAELAEMMGVPAEALQTTVDEYNAAVEAKEDPIHMKKIDFLQYPIAEGPFYGFRVKGSAVNMFGGIHINSNVEVIREDGTVIEGLYAAGLECGGFQGETYGINVPSSCQGIALSTGRRSAKNAVAYAKTV